MATVNEQDKEPGKKELREFGLVTDTILAVLFGLLPVYRRWMAIGHVLGWINTRIILGIMFYLLFLPVGLAMRLLGKDPMARSIDESIATYRVTHARPKKDHVERPY